jgi:hypothetical protein
MDSLYCLFAFIFRKKKCAKRFFSLHLVQNDFVCGTIVAEERGSLRVFFAFIVRRDVVKERDSLCIVLAFILRKMGGGRVMCITGDDFEKITSTWIFDHVA